MQALDGIRVIDMATVIAAPGAARYLADYGADVVKVEAPGGDGTRRMGWTDPIDGDSYMWKLVARGKRTVVPSNVVAFQVKMIHPAVGSPTTFPSFSAR